MSAALEAGVLEAAVDAALSRAGRELYREDALQLAIMGPGNMPWVFHCETVGFNSELRLDLWTSAIYWDKDSFFTSLMSSN